jgi:hypothetical protein
MDYLRKYNTATHLYLPLIKRGVVDFAVGADWTPAAGDVKVSIDGGAAANIGTLPTAIAMGNGAIWDFTLSAGETTGKKITVTVADAATKAVEDQSFSVVTFGNASAEYPPDLSDATALGLSRLDAAITSRMATFTLPTNFSSLAITAGGRVAVQSNIVKNVALAKYPFMMTDATTHAPKTGVTVTATRSIDGGAFGACTNAPVEIANGMYSIDLSAADLNGNTITVRFTGTGADDLDVVVVTTP